MTLKDVAILSNCSIATVSKTFKNSPEVSEDTKIRVLKAAEKCGYIKKATAHTAVLGGIKTVIFSDPKLIYKNQIDTINKLAEKSGLALLYVFKNEADAVKLMEQTGAAGLVLCTFKKQEIRDKILHYSGDEAVLKSFFGDIESFKPKRASRAKNGEKPAPKIKVAEVAPVAETKKEEIWLL